MNAKIVEDWLTQILAEHGFVHARRNWYRNNDQTITVVNLDKSPLGGQLYVNLAASPKEMVGESRPAEHHCHIRVRLESVAQDRELVLRALDLEKDVATIERREVITSAFRSAGLPVLEGFATLEGIVRIIVNHPRAKQFFVRKTLKDDLQRRGLMS